MSSTTGCSRMAFPRRIVFATLCIICLLFVLSPVLVGHRPRSELPTLDIVVSMYREDIGMAAEYVNVLRSLPAFRDLDVRTIIYTKDEQAELASIRAQTDATAVHKLPNVGREGGTYLSHILLNWDDLARHTLFMQAEVHEPDETLQRIRLNFDARRTGVLPLNVLETCRCNNCADPREPYTGFPRLAQLYSAIHGELCPEEISMSYAGQIIVSAKRIKRRKKEIYSHLKAVLESHGHHWIHGDERGELEDDKTNPFFGHTIERSYMVLWDCGDPGIVEECRLQETLIADGTDPNGPGRCQCLDGDAAGVAPPNTSRV